MFNKRLLVSITKTEYEELRKCLNRACELLRESYVRSWRKYK